VPQPLRRELGEGRGGVAERQEERRQPLRLVQRLGGELVPPAERDDAPLAGVAVELELAERERAERVEQRALPSREMSSGS
jgi:hypothetical protein